MLKVTFNITVNIITVVFDGPPPPFTPSLFHIRGYLWWTKGYRDKFKYLNFYQVVRNFTVCPYYHSSLSHLTQHSAVFGERTFLSKYNVIH